METSQRGRSRARFPAPSSGHVRYEPHWNTVVVAITGVAQAICAALSAKDGCPDVLVGPADRNTRWRLGTGEPHSIARGTAAELIGWLSGRLRRPDLPSLPAWF